MGIEINDRKNKMSEKVFAHVYCSDSVLVENMRKIKAKCTSENC